MNQSWTHIFIKTCFDNTEIFHLRGTLHPAIAKKTDNQKIWECVQATESPPPISPCKISKGDMNYYFGKKLFLMVWNLKSFRWLFIGHSSEVSSASERFLNNSLNTISYCSVAERALAQVNAAQGSASNLRELGCGFHAQNTPTAQTQILWVRSNTSHDS